ncbi:hypothetical protein RUND412_008491 [Rhizina undulata]
MPSLDQGKDPGGGFAALGDDDEEDVDQRGVLAKAVKVGTAFTLLEQHLHALRRISFQKLVQITDGGGDPSQERGFRNRIFRQVVFPEGLGAEVPFEDGFAIEAAEDPKDYEEDYFEEVPVRDPEVVTSFFNSRKCMLVRTGDVVEG